VVNNLAAIALISVRLLSQVFYKKSSVYSLQSTTSSRSFGIEMTGCPPAGGKTADCRLYGQTIIFACIHIYLFPFFVLVPGIPTGREIRIPGRG